MPSRPMNLVDQVTVSSAPVRVRTRSPILTSVADLLLAHGRAPSIAEVTVSSSRWVDRQAEPGHDLAGGRDQELLEVPIDLLDQL